MLQRTNIAPKISAYAYMYGQHGFNKMPLAPMGCAVLIQNKPATWKTWEDHASKGYNIETSRVHYRCYKIWMTKTRSIQVANTLLFKHQYITTPTVTKAETIVAVATKLTQVLQEETETNMPQKKQKLKQLAEVLQSVATNFSKKEAEKTSQLLSNATTQKKVANTNTTQGMQKQQSNREAQTTRELTNMRPASKDKVVMSPKNTNQCPHIISQEEEDRDKVNTCPADNTRAKRTHRMLTQECAMAAIHIPKHYPTTANQTPKEKVVAIVDRETGEKLEYHHLKKHP